MLTDRQVRLNDLAEDAVETARDTLGFGLPMSQLGGSAKVAVSQLAAALIEYEARTGVEVKSLSDPRD